MRDGSITHITEMLAPGTILRDSYLIVRLIAQGGMGAVYLAKHQRLGSTVAVKETFFNDASLLKAFEREARLLAGLRHAALPKVIDHFAEGEGHFLVMEFIPGDDLGEMLERRGDAFPVNQVLEWGDQLLGALTYLHKQTPPVIHRDIKPLNLKLTEDDQIVLLDFGLAKGQAEGMSRISAGHSLYGFTPSYAPLEQVRGAGTDGRSDLYALAATLYHLITGSTPADSFSRATAILEGQPDPLQPANNLNPQVPRRVADVLMRTMSQSREQRPANASELRRLLREASGSGQPTEIVSPPPQAAETLPIGSEPSQENDTPMLIAPTPQLSRTTSRWMWAAAVAVFIIGVAVFVWMSSKAPDPGGNTLATDSFNNALATNSPPANANAKAVPLSAAPTASDDGDAAKQKADGPWKHTLQALASTNEFEARSFAARLTNAAIPAYVVSKDIGGTVWYRVRIGRFATVEEARRYAGEVRDRARAAGIALMPLQTTAYEHPQEK